MRSNRTVTSRQANIATAVGVIADVIQLPINVATLSLVFAAPAEALDFAIDTVTAIILTRLLGFHWTLLPTFAIELAPLLDAAPTGTGCTLYVISQRRSDGVLASSRKKLELES